MGSDRRRLTLKGPTLWLRHCGSNAETVSRRSRSAGRGVWERFRRDRARFRTVTGRAGSLRYMWNPVVVEAVVVESVDG